MMRTCLLLVAAVWLLLPAVTLGGTVPSSSPEAMKQKSPQGSEAVKNRPALKDPAKFASKSGACLECHREETPGIFREWLESAHARAGVGCMDCHEATRKDPDAFLHQERFYISSVVTAYDCGRCHDRAMQDYRGSGHQLALKKLEDLQESDPRYPLVARHKQDGFSECAACHGSKVTLNDDKRPTGQTWPNSGAGRINPDGSKGTCAICHRGHRFSVESARRPEACIGCHDGKNYPEAAIFQHSPHGLLYGDVGRKESYASPAFFLDASKIAAPTCATCHMNGAGRGLMTTHNPASRVASALIDPASPSLANAVEQRANMKRGCQQCHAGGVIDRFFVAADQKLDRYQRDVVVPTRAAYEKKLSGTAGETRERLLREFGEFLAASKAYRMNLFMGQHGRTER